MFTNMVYTLTMEYTSRDRRAWIKRYRETGNQDRRIADVPNA